jgi:hypothetical protein
MDSANYVRPTSEPTFTVIVEGIRFASGVAKDMAQAHTEYLRDTFVNPSVTIVKEA